MAATVVRVVMPLSGMQVPLLAAVRVVTEVTVPQLVLVTVATAVTG